MRRADRLVRRLPRGGKQTLRLRLRRRGERRRVGARRRHLGVLASREERSHILRAFAGPSVEIAFEQSNTILSRAASCALSYCQLLVPLLLHLLRRRERNTHARLRAQEARRVQLSAESLPPRISPFLSVSTLSLTRAHRPRAPAARSQHDCHKATKAYTAHRSLVLIGCIAGTAHSGTQGKSRGVAGRPHLQRRARTGLGHRDRSR